MHAKLKPIFSVTMAVTVLLGSLALPFLVQAETTPQPATSSPALFNHWSASVASQSPNQTRLNNRTMRQAITPTGAIQLNPIGTYDSGGEATSEIATYDPVGQLVYVSNGEDKRIDVLDISNPALPTLVRSLPITRYGAGINSVDFHSYGPGATEGFVAAAVEADPKQNPGQVVFFNRNGEFVAQVTVGALPDMVTFTSDGQKVLVANEGEPNADYTTDPLGSISIIDLSGGVATVTQTNVTTLDFTAFNGREHELRAEGIRIFGNNNASSAAQDFEPEYIAVSPDNSTAVVTLQENNALAIVDLTNNTIKDVTPLGYKDHAKGPPTLQQYQFTNLPVLGTTAITNPQVPTQTTPSGQSQQILMGGFSGLWFEGMNGDNYKFATVPDRGPNADPTTINGQAKRPFGLPDYQARVVRFELNPTSGALNITEQIMLSRTNGISPITGLPNIPGQDEIPIDLFGNELPYDEYGADMEGLVINPADGHFWMVDEYRPAIYHFAPTGTLVARYVPTGTATLGGQPVGTYGTETLPAAYSKRRANRGFEGMALDTEKGILYAFIQTPLENPDRAASNASSIIRMLGINPADGTPVAEYIYLLERPEHRPGSGVDKIGDAMFIGDGKFYVAERDSAVGATAKKYLFQIDLKGATNILTATLPTTKTLEQHTPDELMAANIYPVFKQKVANLPSLGYTAGDKVEGLALVTAGPLSGSLAILNDNDFGLLGQPLPTPPDGTIALNPNPVQVVLGIVSFAQQNKFDASNRDNGINITTHPTWGMYQPDSIDAFSAGGNTYFITANEGDARDYDGYSEEVRVADLNLDANVFPNTPTLTAEDNLGRLKTTTANGDVDRDGDVDMIYSYGARSFSIWDVYGNLVYDSRDDFEQITAIQVPQLFNSQGTTDTLDSRSDDKGPEPEGVVIGEVDGRTYAFIGLERVNGIMIYDVTDAKAPVFVNYQPGVAGDLSPEGLKFIPADQSPNGKAILIVANEVSGSVTMYQIGDVVPTGGLPNGVAAGDTTHDSTVLWTRSEATGPVTFTYSMNQDLSGGSSMTATVTNVWLPVKVSVTGLNANTSYYYQVTNYAGVTATGKFKTAATAGITTGLRFGVSGDWRGELAPYPAVSNAVNRNLNFFVAHGDTIYADYPSPALMLDQATTITDYRKKQAEVYGSRFGMNTLGDLRANTSILATIDDHEVTNDFAGGADASTDPRFPETTGLINDTQLYDNGLQAFQEYNPIHDRFYGDVGNSRINNERKLYRYQTYGNDAAVFVLDTRSFRDAPLTAVTDPNNAAAVGQFLTNTFDASRTMLGSQQLADLKADLMDAQSKGITWKFVMVPEPIQNLGVFLAQDRFEGYAAERTEILKFINDNNISNVVFVAADIHGTIVNNLTYQEGVNQPQIPTGAFEVSTGSVAFYEPFGPTVVDLSEQLGLITPTTKAAYEALPINSDSDSLVNDKDDFLKNLANSQLALIGYDPVGLNDNLPVANGLIDATLLQGDYLATHTYGWTEFDIDPTTQQLIVTTYGIDDYSQAEMEANPDSVKARTPQIVSQFTVTPTTLVSETVKLTLLHNNDGESTIRPLTNGVAPGSGYPNTENVNLQVSGVAAYKAVLDREMAQAQQAGHTVLNVYAGDAFLASATLQCSLPLDSDKPVYDAIAQRQMNYDAHILGNHEFDYTPIFLKRFIEAFTINGSLTHPFLSGNLDFSNQPEFANLIDEDGIFESATASGRVVAKSAIITKNGQQFGIVSAIYPGLATISSPGNVQVTTADVNEAVTLLQQQIDALHNRGVNKIILVSHLQVLDTDRTQVIPQLSGVDVAVGGGGDELLVNNAISATVPITEQLLPGEDMDDIKGNYPLEAQDKDGKTVYIVTTAGNYKYMGRLDVEFDAEGNVTRMISETSYPRRVIPNSTENTQAIAALGITDAVVPDATVQTEVVAEVEACLNEFGNTVVATSTVLLDVSRSGVRGEETNTGNLVTDAYLYTFQKYAAANGIAPPGNHTIAVQNGGGMRQNAGDVLPVGGQVPGPVTLLNTFDVLAFTTNQLTVIRNVPPADVKAIFERSVSRIGGGQFLQVSGLKIVYDVDKTAQVIANDGTVTTPGERIISIVLADGTAIVQNGQVITSAPSITITTNSFTAGGGDNYPWFANNSDKTDIRDNNGVKISYDQAWREYMQDPATTDRLSGLAAPQTGLGGVIPDIPAYRPGGEGRLSLPSTPTYYLPVILSQNQN